MSQTPPPPPPPPPSLSSVQSALGFCTGCLNSNPFQERPVYMDQPIKISHSVAHCPPAQNNATFDCRVLSRNHALLWFNHKMSKTGSSCPGTHSLDQAGLKLRDLPSSASRVQELKVCTTTALPEFVILEKLVSCAAGDSLKVGIIE